MKKIIVKIASSNGPATILEFVGNNKIALHSDGGFIVVKDDKGDFLFIGSKDTCFAYIVPEGK